MNELLARFRLLPLLVLVGTLAFAVRVGETVSGVRDMAASAIASEGAKKGEGEKKPAKEDRGEKEKGKKGEGEGKEGEKAAPKVPFGPDPTAGQPQAGMKVNDSSLPEVWADPAQQDMADSPEQLRLNEDLAKRRMELDAREKALDTREAIMKASESQIDEKISEMSQLKSQIEQLLGQQDVQEKNRIQSLVKIYEGMKPKDAATIFNQMDMSVLLKVVSRMSERKLAPIVAAMDTARANELTVRLTELRKLPDAEPVADANAPAATDAPPGSAPLPGLDALGTNKRG